MTVIDPTATYRLPGPDTSVPRRSDEGWTHWAGKASIVTWLEGINDLSGRVESEKKVEDLIADIRCTFENSVEGVPNKCVYEVQTRESSTDILQRIRRLHRYGFTVYYIYPDTASNHRRSLETRLAEYMPQRPDLGRLSLKKGELQLGTPLGPGDLAPREVTLPYNEFYIPTHKRSAQAFDFGDFAIDSVQTALVAIDDHLYTMAEVGDTGQRTLPISPKMTKEELERKLIEGEITRESPVRGTPQGN